MPKTELVCASCGRKFEAYASSRRRFCRHSCFYEYQHRFHKAPHLTKYNKLHNKDRMTENVRCKLREKRLGNGGEKGYAKILGLAAHRVLAEIDLGRDLLPGEVVHHIDGDKRNNSTENLMIFPNQAEHAKWHAKHEKREAGDQNAI